MVPDELRLLIWGHHEGLTLYFNTRLAPVDRFLIDGVIYGVLGKDTDCQVVEFKQQEHSATVRMQAQRREDLEKVAEMLYQEVWKRAEHVQTQALVKMANLLGPRDMLTDLRRRLDHVELHLQQQQVWRWDLAQDHVQLARPVRLFLCYAPEDELHRQQMERHLAALRRQGLIESWHAGMLLAGDDADPELGQHLTTAEVVVLLVSADLLSSDAIYAKVQHALQRHAAGQVRLVPVLVRPVDLAGTELAQLQALPEGGPAITRWEDRDEAWAAVASGIRRVVLGMMGPRALPAPLG